MGKGSKARPVDIKKYRGNWDEIQWPSKSNLSPEMEEKTLEDIDLQPAADAIQKDMDEQVKQDFIQAMADTIGAEIESIMDKDKLTLLQAVEKMLSVHEVEKLVKTPKGMAKRYVYR